MNIKRKIITLSQQNLANEYHMKIILPQQNILEPG